MGKNLFIDAEWYLNQDIYLIGYAYDLSATYQLYDSTINKLSFASILTDVDAIYCYGPDIGMLEKFFDCDLKTYYYCFNLLSIIKKYDAHFPSYRLSDLEKFIGLQRTTSEYKANIFNLHKDWKDPVKRSYAMKYNQEDVHNMIRVKNFFFQLNKITRKDIVKYRL